jgi:hypothetical protein
VEGRTRYAHAGRVRLDGFDVRLRARDHAHELARVRGGRRAEDGHSNEPCAAVACHALELHCRVWVDGRAIDKQLAPHAGGDHGAERVEDRGVVADAREHDVRGRDGFRDSRRDAHAPAERGVQVIRALLRPIVDEERTREVALLGDVRGHALRNSRRRKIAAGNAKRVTNATHVTKTNPGELSHFFASGRRRVGSEELRMGDYASSSPRIGGSMTVT